MIEIIEILLTTVYILECTVVQCKDAFSIYWNRHGHEQGRIQDFKLGGGAHLKFFFEVFHVKNQYFTPKNHIFAYCEGKREHFWGFSCENSRFYAKKSYFFQLRREARKFLGYFV